MATDTTKATATDTKEAAASSNLIRDVIDRGSVMRLQVLVVCISLTLNMLDGFDVTAMAFTVHGIGEQLQIAPDLLGLVFSAALAGMMIGAMFIAPISDRIGRRSMVLACVTTIGTSMIMTSFATELWHLILLRLITGLGVGAMLASLTALTSEYTPEKYRTLAIVIITAGYPLGATVGGFIAAPMIPIYGWESVFFAGGAVTLSMSVLVYFLIPESLQFLIARRPKNALSKVNTILSRLQQPALQELPHHEVHAHTEKASVSSLLVEQRRKQTIMLWTTFLFCFICLYFLMSWIPKLVVNAGLSESFGVYASVAFTGGGTIGIVILGWLATKFRLSNLIALFLSLAAIGMVIFAVADGVNNLIAYFLVIGFFQSGGFSGLYAVAAKIYPTEVRATGVGWAIGLGRFGAVLGPYVGGVLIASGMSMEINFIIFSIPLLIGGLLSYFLNVK